MCDCCGDAAEMAGGKKQQKKRKKKSWRSILEGCFHRPTLGGNKLEESPEHQAPQETPQGETASLKPPQTLQDFEEKITHLQNSERVRLRGILKKSPSISSCSSPLYAEAANHDAAAHSGSRPALLLDCKTDSCGSAPEEPYERHVYDTRRLKTINGNHSDGQSAFTPYSSRAEVHGYSGGVVAGSYNKSKSGPSPKSSANYDLPESSGQPAESGTRVFDPLYDTYNQSYEALKDRLYRRCHGQNRYSDSSSHYATSAHSQDKIYSKPPSGPSGHESLAAGARGDETYVQLHEIQFRKQHQRNHSVRPLSAPPASWHGQYIMSACDSDNRIVPADDYSDYSEIPDNHHHSKKALVCPGMPQVSPHSRYIASAVPRSRDPIRKPMGSQYCPYPVHPSHLQDDHSSDHPPGPTDQDSLEISHIFTTVTRSGNETTTSSYIYASISWKGGHDPGPHPPVVSSPPPVPPRHWAGPAHSAGMAPPARCHGRPPLPSYDEVIESRMRSGRDRPLSWSEFSHVKETERKREAFMQLLAQRYPQYADKIQGTCGSQSPQPVERVRMLIPSTLYEIDLCDCCTNIGFS
ncbi:hypothetical protein Btru_060512 [Bulinus truncatus]|nr:hypothetical protein Btru_060512 [Bulinus truncatus]